MFKYKLDQEGLIIPDEYLKPISLCCDNVCSAALNYSELYGKPMIESDIEKQIEVQVLLNIDGDELDKNKLYKFIKHEVDIRVAQRIEPGICLINKKENHVEWLEDALADTSIEWEHWNYYRTVIAPPNKPEKRKILDKINKETNDILSLLENPKRYGAWDNRGLVVGDVQMGKTSNYIGLMAKAVDAGYKVLIVLAGSTNDLRRQTQLRIDEGLLGVNFHPNITIHAATSSDPKGDYSTSSLRSSISLYGKDCVLFVVKKNGTVLRNILKYIDRQRKDNEKLPIPLLMIDDEADYGSPNTNTPKVDPLTGDIIDKKDLDPTIINRYIRAILTCFEKTAYVAYTATPYANIFGLPRHDKDRECFDKGLGKTLEVGEDLFPRNFIYKLEPPINYIGPQKVFGSGEDGDDGLPIVIDLQKKFPEDFEYEGDDNSNTEKFELNNNPSSLKYAINCFIISSVIKDLRCNKFASKHNTMLIHIDRLVNKQKIIKTWVIDYVSDLKDLFTKAPKEEQDEYLEKLYIIWQEEYYSKFKIISSSVIVPGLTPVTWDSIVKAIPCFIKVLCVKVVNGAEMDALDYDNHKTGLNVIAIGGDKLSRGLTLDGLSVSYFVRSAGTYDTLTQMGRWFGYRDGYIDVCRLFVTTKVVNDFHEITLALIDLNRQFYELYSSGATPLTYGLRVLTDPNSKILITAKNKSKPVFRHEISFSGSPIPTAYLPVKKEINKENLVIIKSLITVLGKPSGYANSLRDTGNSRSNLNIYWENVNSSLIIENFLSSKFFIDNQNSWFSLSEIKTFVEKSNLRNEITNWTVVVVSGGLDKKIKLNSFIEINISKRSIEKSSESYYELSRRRLPSSIDEAFDLSQNAFNVALDETNKERAKKNLASTDTPNPRSIRKNRNKKNALLLIYLLNLYSNEELITDDVIPGFMISFPELKYREMDQSYWGNTVYAQLKQNSVGEAMIKGDFDD